MNLSEAKYLSRADSLIQDLEDRIISPDDREELMGLMREHYGVRELYLKHTDMVALLKESAETRAELGTMPVSEKLLQTQRRKSAMVSFFYSIAALLIIGIGLFALRQGKRPTSEVTDIVLQSSDGAIFIVADEDGKSKSDTKIKIGDKLSIDQGLIQLKLSTGVEVIMEGPSELMLVSDDNVKMNGGMAWFRVSDSAHGFTVQTTKADIIDLGTEFGVLFDNSENIQVHVAKGKVRVESKQRKKSHYELNADEAIIIDESGDGNEMNCEASLFRQEFTKSIPYLYWSFDELINDAFPAKGTMKGEGGFQLKIHRFGGSVKQGDFEKYHIKGKHGQAFTMDGSGVFAESLFRGVGGNTPRTVAMWVRHRSSHDTRGMLTPYCVWGTREPGKLWKILLKDEPTESLITGTMGSGQSSVPRNSPKDSYSWVHIASVFTGRMTEKSFPEIIHYINGELYSTEPVNAGYKLNTDITSENSKPLRIGATLEGIMGDNTVDGDIDELFIIRGVMSQEQVQKLMNTNRLDF